MTFWYFSSSIFQSIYCLKQKLDGMLLATLRLKIAKIILLTYPKCPCTKQPSWNSSNNIFQTICTRGQNLMVGISQISQLPISLHSDTYSGNAYNGLHWNLQTTSSKFYALLRLRIAKILPFRYQRWPCTKQLSWKSSNNIFQPIFSLKHKIDGKLQGKMGTQNCLNHSIQISKIAIIWIGIMKFYQWLLPSNHMGLVARKPVFWGLRTTQAQTSLRIGADWSAPLLFPFRKVTYVHLLQE